MFLIFDSPAYFLADLFLFALVVAAVVGVGKLIPQPKPNPNGWGAQWKR